MSVPVQKWPCSWWGLLIIVFSRWTLPCNQVISFNCLKRSFFPAQIHGVKAKSYFSVERAHEFLSLGWCWIHSALGQWSAVLLSWHSAGSEFLVMKQVTEQGEVAGSGAAALLCVLHRVLDRKVFSLCKSILLWRTVGKGSGAHIWEDFPSVAGFKLWICGFELWLLKCLVWACYNNLAIYSLANLLLALLPINGQSAELVLCNVGRFTALLPLLKEESSAAVPLTAVWASVRLVDLLCPLATWTPGWFCILSDSVAYPS